MGTKVSNDLSAVGAVREQGFAPPAGGMAGTKVSREILGRSLQIVSQGGIGVSGYPCGDPLLTPPQFPSAAPRVQEDKGKEEPKGTAPARVEAGDGEKELTPRGLYDRISSSSAAGREKIRPKDVSEDMAKKFSEGDLSYQEVVDQILKSLEKA